MDVKFVTLCAVVSPVQCPLITRLRSDGGEVCLRQFVVDFPAVRCLLSVLTPYNEASVGITSNLVLIVPDKYKCSIPCILLALMIKLLL